MADEKEKHEEIVPASNAAQPAVKVMGQNLTEKDFRGFKRPPVKIISNRSKTDDET